jgi:RNA polymerase sigma-70 factor (ECF subfamily)
VVTAPELQSGERLSRARAASELFYATYPRLAGWCRRLVGDTETAHEIASESFVRLWSRWSAVDDPHGFLYVTATNLIRDYWRRVERERRATRRASASLGRTEHEPEAVEPDLRGLVQALLDHMRAAVLLHYYAGFPIREVASLLNRKESTVKSDLHRARARLRAELEAWQ